MIILITITISPHRRQVIKNIVLSALRYSQNASLPVKIKSICKAYPNIRLVSFSTQMERRNITYKDMIEFCGTSDSCADYDANLDKYIIYYNDIELTRIVNSNRYRWNIAHELGHILLGHHKCSHKTRIYRCSLSDEEYNYLEAEADYFAQLILVPHVVLYAFRIQNERQLKSLCKISNPAATRRFRAYKEWLKNINGDDPYDRPLFQYYYKYIFKKQCSTCGAHIIQARGIYCPICGNTTLQWGDGKMIYSKIELNEKNKPKKCPICDNEETLVDGNYCQICGTYLLNECSNETCGASLPSNARYCSICGSRSTYLQMHFLNVWNYRAEVDGFVDIPDEFPYDVEEEGLPFN